MSQPSESLTFYQTRLLIVKDERDKAMERLRAGTSDPMLDKAAMVGYQILLREYQAQINRYKAETVE